MPSYRAKKRLGQNFLISEEIIDRIVKLIDPDNGEQIIEIGPGRGALTLKLAEKNAVIAAVEFDRDLISHLQKLVSTFPRVNIVNADFLDYVPEWQNFILVGNLPYNITSPVIDWAVRYRSQITKTAFLVQKEVALRIAASPGNKDWSPLSIFTQLYYDVRLCFDVAAEHFKPQPKVVSSVIELVPKPAIEVENFDLLENVVRTSFRQRRKLLVNNLIPDILENRTVALDILDKLGLSHNSRAEEISISQFLKLTELVKAHNVN